MLVAGLSGIMSMVFALVGARASEGAGAESPVLEILRSHEGLAEVTEAAPRFRLQVVLGRVEEGKDGRPVLRQEGFRVGTEYFYPASSIKLFAAVAALERLAELRERTGLPLDADTPLVYRPLFPGEVIESNDSTNRESGRITVRHEIRKLFLVSDNEAFNRLYELVGQDGLAASLERAGLGETRIVHRLSEARTAEENRWVPRIDLVGEGFHHTVSERRSEPLPAGGPVPGLWIGKSYLADGELVEEPMDFAPKNRISLADLQRGLCMVVRPDVECGGSGYGLSAPDRDLLLEPMSQYPRESANPVYDSEEYPDSWGKFLLPGLVRVIPEGRLRIYNKIGRAYGFSVENAYVLDEETGRAFFLAATLSTNADGILNDDEYEYEEIADPFLADLGEAVARALWTTRDSPAPD